MSNLNNTMRQSIENAAMQHAFNARIEEYKAAETALARKCYAACYPADVLAAINALPVGWLYEDKCLIFQIGIYRAQLQIWEGDGVRVPYGNCRERGSIQDPEIMAEFEALQALRRALDKDREDARAALRGLLASCASLKRLRERWPEGEQFYSGFDAKAPGLPAVTSEKVNKLLGLARAEVAHV